jgi:hypothetical protein
VPSGGNLVARGNGLSAKGPIHPSLRRVGALGTGGGTLALATSGALTTLLTLPRLDLPAFAATGFELGFVLADLGAFFTELGWLAFAFTTGFAFAFAPVTTFFDSLALANAGSLRERCR